jgi:hypothetical protein
MINNSMLISTKMTLLKMYSKIHTNMSSIPYQPFVHPIVHVQYGVVPPYVGGRLSTSRGPSRRAPAIPLQRSETQRVELLRSAVTNA